ncbi:MAG: hypothetical protein R8G34_13860 [Paracoccaceae bacterium]|nr:hypothetical protein [Paracoccaceae bacterium]
MSPLPYVICVLLALGFPHAAVSQSSAVPIGRTEWTNPNVSGRPPGNNTARVLAPRIRIVEREAVNTSDRGAADFFFVNQSRLLVGPSCRVVLDGRFYDAELDTEVKEFSLGTALRCITKAENILADNPQDQIFISTPRGKIVIAGAVATIALAADDKASGLPKRGNPVSAPLQVTVTAVKAGGFVSLTGPNGGAGNTEVIRRSGFVLWVDEFGAVRGPDRETPEKAAQLRAPLSNVVSQDTRASATASSGPLSEAFQLADPETVEPINLDGPRSFRPPDSCLTGSCSGLDITR